MPRVVITFNDETGDYYMDAYDKGVEYDPEYQVVVDLKSSHFQNIVRNRQRVCKDQDFLRNFFIQAQMAGRAIREQ